MTVYYNNTTKKRNQWDWDDKARCINLFNKDSWTTEQLAVEFKCKKQRIVKMLRCHGYLGEIN